MKKKKKNCFPSRCEKYKENEKERRGEEDFFLCSLSLSLSLRRSYPTIRAVSQSLLCLGTVRTSVAVVLVYFSVRVLFVCVCVCIWSVCDKTFEYSYYVAFLIRR